MRVGKHGLSQLSMSILSSCSMVVLNSRPFVLCFTVTRVGDGQTRESVALTRWMRLGAPLRWALSASLTAPPDAPAILLVQFPTLLPGQLLAH